MNFSRTHSNKKDSGFTLIELSIVLVIIALVVGGVMVGKDMIESAKLQSQISQTERYKTAFSAFRQKYNCFPGDCAAASRFGLSTAGSNPAYIGNEKIDNRWSYFHNADIYNFWGHLSAAGLIEGNYLGWDTSLNVADQTTIVSNWSNYFPKEKLGSGYFTAVNITVSAGTGSGPSTLGNSLVMTGRVSCASVLCYGSTLTPLQAFQIDTKTDDGSPVGGKVQVAAINYFTSIDTPNTGYAGCTSGTPVTYATTSTSIGCMLAMQLQ